MSVVGDLLVNAIARGVGQVAFANNPVSGAIILVALCWPLPYTYALLASIGLFASTGTALWLGLGRTALNNGLFTFNGVLVGQASATFLVLDTTVQIVSACIAVAVFSAFAALLTQALGNLLVAHHKVPPFTLPFNLATLCLLLFVASTPNSDMLQLRSFVTPSPLPLPSDADATESYMDTMGMGAFVQAVFRGVAQIWLCDSYVSGIAVVTAIGLYSPTSAAMAVLGSLVGACTAMAFGVPSPAIEAGLWGYNASLGAIAIGGLFYLLTWRTLGLAIVTAVLCTAIHGALGASFRGTGMPVMTLPFCFGTMVVVMLRAFQPISLATMTTPEEHSWRFATLKKQKAAATRAALVTFGNLHAGFVAALEDYQHQVMERRGLPAQPMGKRSRSTHPRWRIAVGGAKQHPDRGMPWLSMPMALANVLLDGRSVFALQFRRAKSSGGAQLAKPRSTLSLTTDGETRLRRVSTTKLDTLGSSLHNLLYTHQPSFSGASTSSSSSDDLPLNVHSGSDGDLFADLAGGVGAQEAGVSALEDLHTSPLRAAQACAPVARASVDGAHDAAHPRFVSPLSSVSMQVDSRDAKATPRSSSPGLPIKEAKHLQGTKSAHCLLGELGGDGAASTAAEASPARSRPTPTPLSAVVITLDGDDVTADIGTTVGAAVRTPPSTTKKPRSKARVVTFTALATGVGLPEGVDGKALVQCLLAPSMGSLGALVARLTLRQGVSRRQTGYGHFTGSLAASGKLDEL